MLDFNELAAWAGEQRILFGPTLERPGFAPMGSPWNRVAHQSEQEIFPELTAQLT